MSDDSASSASSASSAKEAASGTVERLVQNAREGGVVLWAAVAAGPAAWAAHLTLAAALVEVTCTDKGWTWLTHLITVATALATLAGLLVCAAMVRDNGDDEGEDTFGGRTKFMGQFGILVGAVSLALILLEQSYVFFISPCA